MHTTMKLLLAVAVIAGTAIAGGVTGKWSTVSSDMCTILLSMSAWPTANAGGPRLMLPCSQNGAGASVLESNNRGKTWTNKYEGGLMYMASAASGRYGIAVDMLDIITTRNNGSTFFTAGQDDPMVGCQSADAVGSTFVGAGSTLGNLNGVAVSTNGGANFTFHNITELTTFARYVATPTEQVFYVSAGEWPESGDDDAGLMGLQAGDVLMQRLSARTSLVAKDGDKSQPRVRYHPAGASGGNGNGWAAQIVKTTDGGSTWTSVFSDTGSFYFNDISCSSADHCCAVGESDAGPEPGVRVHCTSDGGKSWNRPLFFEEASMSLMAISGVPGQPGALWLGGGNLTETDFTGYYWYTSDGGKTFMNQTVSDAYANSITMLGPDSGFATAFTAEGESSVVEYTA